MKIKMILMAMVLVALSGCADYVSPRDILYVEQVGFLHGLWHGIIIVPAWVFSAFSSDIAIYATYNSGGWYDFGFMLGLGILGGSNTQNS
jgi:hypothetical protein